MLKISMGVHPESYDGRFFKPVSPDLAIFVLMICCSAMQENRPEFAHGNETVLIIEDEEIILNLAKDILEKYGYTVLTAEDGQKGIDEYVKNKDTIDLILLDLTMPEMSGQMVFEEMLKIDPKIRVIISSGHSDEETRKGILSLAKGYVKKPYKMNELTQAVRAVLDS